jgi:hypothetical protein
VFKLLLTCFSSPRWKSDGYIVYGRPSVPYIAHTGLRPPSRLDTYGVQGFLCSPTNLPLHSTLALLFLRASSVSFHTFHPTSTATTSPPIALPTGKYMKGKEIFLTEI